MATLRRAFEAGGRSTCDYLDSVQYSVPYSGVIYRCTTVAWQGDEA